MQPTVAHSSRTQIVVLILVFAFLLIVAVVMGKNSYNRPIRTKENVVVKSTDIKAVTNESDKLPQGFPTFIPVETKRTTESYAMNFPDRKLTQYTVNYTTDKTLDQKYKEYTDFMSVNGFVVKPSTDTVSTKTLFASKGNDDLLIVLSAVGKDTTVQIAYVDRQ